jgi:hypothetical protein
VRGNSIRSGIFAAFGKYSNLFGPREGGIDVDLHSTTYHEYAMLLIVPYYEPLSIIFFLGPYPSGLFEEPKAMGARSSLGSLWGRHGSADDARLYVEKSLIVDRNIMDVGGGQVCGGHASV